MTIEAKIVEDSITCSGTRLTTFVLRYHRFVHAELMTHRLFSRNASSSRAIPVERMIAWTREDPACPVEWGKNQAGMQAKALLDPDTAALAKKIWLNARMMAEVATMELVELGVHKQIANRLLEPWHHITVIVSATQFANWFSLRHHPDAQPEIQALARKMAEVYRASEPRLLLAGNWHLPFVTETERTCLATKDLLKCSVARCARVSYRNHDGTAPSVGKDMELHDKLVAQRPLHASPAEHQATPLHDDAAIHQYSPLSGNFQKDWKQYRKMLPHECSETFPWDEEVELRVDGNR